MARGRMLSKSLGCSRRFNAVPALANGLAEFAQLLFMLIVSHADDFGRMTADPFSVKLTVLPASGRSTEDFVVALEALHESRLLTIYLVEDDLWLQIDKFDEHQSGLHKRTASKIPNPIDNSRKFPEIPGHSGSRARAELNLTELKGRELKGTEKKIPQVITGVISSTSPQVKAATPSGSQVSHRLIAKQLADELHHSERTRKRAKPFR